MRLTNEEFKNLKKLLNDIQKFCDKAGLILESFKYKKRLRLHAVIRKIQ